MKIRTKAVAAVVAFVMLLSNMPMAQDVAAQRRTYFEITERREVSRGVWFTESRRVVEGGLLDVYVLEVPLGDPYIELSVLNAAEHGLRNHTTSILTEHGAVAGVNGDFFGMVGTHTFPLGLEINNNGALSTVNNFNYANNGYATFFIDDNGVPFIDFITTHVAFFNNGAMNIYVGAINKTVDVTWPVALTVEYLRCTAILDSRSPYIVKIIVEDGIITRITAPGETVYIPENGFIIALPNWIFQRYRERVAVGQTAHMDIRSNINLNALSAAISGGGMILRGGQPVSEGTIPAGRHPRTAVGFTEDRQTAILMVVDGRTHSIGATHVEMAELMLEFGAFYAMHLDGGGSATMGVSNEPWLAPTMANTPSDGAQRRVINALGVLANAPVSANLVSLEIEMGVPVLTMNHPNRITVSGRDEFRRRIDVSDVYIMAIGAVVEYGYVIPYQETVRLLIVADGIVEDKILLARNVSRITPNVRSINAVFGTSVPLSFSAVSTDGFQINVNADAVQFEVFPSSLGFVENGVFRATGVGRGFIRASLNGASAYISIGMPSDLSNVFNNAIEAHYFLHGLQMNGAAVQTPSDVVVSDNRFGSLSGFLGSFGNGVVDLSVNIQNGGISATDPLQWSKIENAVLNAQYIVIRLNAEPGTFRHRREFDMLHDLLKNAVFEGRTVVLAHPGVGAPYARDGVWYLRS